MIKSRKGPSLFLRFGISRKKDFLKDIGKIYDGLVLPGNVLLYQYRSTPSVVYMCKKPFFVDPMSYLFGQPFESLKRNLRKGLGFKPSFDKLMLGHGLESDDFLSGDYNSLLKFLNSSEKNINGFIEHALDFQKNKVWTTIQAAKELMVDSSTLNEADFRPAFLIPPYFLYEDVGAVSKVLNQKILKYCHTHKSDWGDIFPMIFIKKEQLRDGLLEAVVALINSYDFPGVCIWPEDFDEREVSEEDILGLVKLVKSFPNKQIVMLYGGFFSMILSHFGLSAICHGLAYGEARTVSAATNKGSGPAPIRYYLNDLHCFLTLEDALVILRARKDLLCDCPACSRIVKGNPENIIKFQDEEAMAEIHFLWNRNEERKKVAESSIENLIDYLGVTLELNDDIGKITRRYEVHSRIKEKVILDTNFLSTWKMALEKAISTLP